MSTRLTFLYPHLFRAVRSHDQATSLARQCRRSSARRATFATSTRSRQVFVQRHGKAVEPFLMDGETEADTKVFLPEETPADVKTEEKSESTQSENEASTEERGGPEKQQPRRLSEALSEETQAAARLPGDAQIPEDESSIKNASVEKEFADQETDSRTADIPASNSDTINEVLMMDPPPDLSIPHLHPPPYVHNFDSYTLVKEVEKGGFTPDQAITSMKAVRVLLAEHLEIAKEGLVSKSDVENEAYLFKAACSELKTEIQNARKARDEKMRQERTLLMHEVEILNQKTTQELLVLKDELQGMFNDRKMAVRMEQRRTDSQIQGLQYKITVALNSDAKSEVEGLRWVLTRRSVMGILFMALMVLSSLRFGAYRAHEEEMELKRKEKQRKEDEEAKKHHRMVDADVQTEGGDSATVAEALSAN